MSNDFITWIKVNKDGLVLDWNYHKFDKSLNDTDFESSFDCVIFFFFIKNKEVF